MRRWWRVALLAPLALWACSREASPPQPGDPCGELADCARTVGLSCRLGVCEQIACARSLDCPAGAACVAGRCSAPECAEDAGCGDGERCFEGDCRDDLCRTRLDCPEGQVCLGTPPTCLPPPEACRDDAECPAGTSCKLPAARCVASCGVTASCGEERWCDDGLCRALCAEDRDCDLEELCVEGRCQAPRDCSEEPTCPGARTLRDPRTCACVECLDALDCAVERREGCALGQCVLCEVEADSEAVCRDLDLFARGGCCVECLADADCEAGELCERGRCIDLLEQRCVTDADCREELICDGERCTAPASLAACDVQADCPGGEACYGDGRCRVEAVVCHACPAPGRCIAEPGDRVGTCAGCTEPCAEAGCPDGARCFVPEGVAEGWCVEASFSGCPR